MTRVPLDEADRGLDPADFRAEFAALYDELEIEVRRLGPVCNLSGLCCRFREYDHTLFLSAPEAALLLADAPRPSRPLDDGASCPWQDLRGRCTARSARPLGCRLYFCDPAYQEEGRRLGEDYIRRLKSLIGRLGLPWDYAPLHGHLRIAAEEGRLAPPATPEGDEIAISDYI